MSSFSQVSGPAHFFKPFLLILVTRLRPAHFFKPFLLILVTRLHVQITAVRYLHESDFLPSQRFSLAIWGVKI
jgi:hypothetical protein